MSADANMYVQVQCRCQLHSVYYPLKLVNCLCIGATADQLCMYPLKPVNCFVRQCRWRSGLYVRCRYRSELILPPVPMPFGFVCPMLRQICFACIHLETRWFFDVLLWPMYINRGRSWCRLYFFPPFLPLHHYLCYMTARNPQKPMWPHTRPFKVHPFVSVIWRFGNWHALPCSAVIRLSSAPAGWGQRSRDTIICGCHRHRGNMKYVFSTVLLPTDLFAEKAVVCWRPCPPWRRQASCLWLPRNSSALWQVCILFFLILLLTNGYPIGRQFQV